MRTSLNEIKIIESYLTNTLEIGDRLVFQARMLTDRTLRKNVALQRQVYSLVRFHHKMSLKQEFQKLHIKLFNDEKNTSLKEEVLRIFNP